MPARPRRPVVLALLPLLLAACARRGDAEEPADAPPVNPVMQGIFDPAAVDRGAPPPPLPAAPLAILDVGPRGKSSGGGDIHVRFNQPIVAAGVDEAAEGLLEISPAVAGHARWKSPDLLVFTPDDALPPATAFTVRLKGPVIAVDGRRYADPQEWSFETPRPQVSHGGLLNLQATHYERARHRRTAAYVVFDQPTSIAEVRAHVRATARALSPAELDSDEAGSSSDEATPSRREPAPIKVEAITAAMLRRSVYGDALGEPEPGTAYLITPVGLWPGASRITIEVEGGVRGRGGPLPSDTPWEESFDTYGPQSIVQQSCPKDEVCALEPLQYTLRNPIKPRELKKITVSPKPKGLSVSLTDGWYDEEGGREVLIQGVFLPGKTYKVTIGGQVRDVYGQALGGTFTHMATIDRAPTLGISDTSAILRASQPRTFGVTTRHVQTLEVRATKLPDAAVQATLRRVDLNGVAGLPRASTKTIPLTPKGPTDWSEIAVDLADLVGDYRGAVLVEVHATSTVPAAAGRPLPDPVRGLFRITDMGPVLSLSAPRSTLQVVDLERAQAVVGATVEHRVGDRVTTLGTTDKAGYTPLPGTAEWPCGDPKKSSKGAKAKSTKSKDTKSKDTKSKDTGKSRAAAAAEAAAEPKEATTELGRCEPGYSARDGLLIVRDPKSADVAYLSVGAASELWGAKDRKALKAGESLIQRVITERGAYRPGEEIHVMGWTAVTTPFRPSGLRRLSARTGVTIEALNPRGEAVATAEVKTTREGKYSATLVLPEHAPLGHYRVVARIDEAQAQTGVKVEDYRTPEFQVEARVERGDVIAGEPERVLVNASYYFGGPVPIEGVRTRTECTHALYRPPGLDRLWAVGPRSLDYRRRRGYSGPSTALAKPSPQEPATSGAVDFEVNAHAPLPGLIDRCGVSVEVRDASLQAIGAETGYVAHSASFYLAVALPESRLRAGDHYDVPLRAIHWDGHRVGASKVAVKVERTYDEPVYREESGRKVLYGYNQRTKPVTTCTLDLGESGDDARCKLPTLAEGTYSITATASEGARTTLSEATFYVRSKRSVDWTWSAAPPSRLDLEVSTRSVRPGDPIKVRVRAPWERTPAILFIERGGIREARALVVGKDGAELTLTADDTWSPKIHLEAIAVRPGDATTLPEVERDGEVITQDQEHRRLQVRVEAPPEIGPGDRAKILVELRDADGAPARGRVALWVVDEAVLDLTGYEVPDLLPSFVAESGAHTSRSHDFNFLRLPFHPSAEDDWLLEGGYGVGYGSGYGAGGAGHSAGGVAGGVPVPPARSRFKTTPVFLADLEIGDDGRRLVDVEAPENLTTFRVFAVASSRLVDGESPGRFGLGDSRIRVTRPLVLRSILPRGLRPGDRAEIAAILQNRSGKPGTLEVQAAVVGDTAGVKIVGSSSAKATITGDGQVRLPFSIVAERPGTPEIELQAVLVADGGGATKLTDGMRVPIPIEAERTQIERVAVYGTVADDQPIGIPIRVPTAVLPGYGGVTVSTTSTLLGGLEDAIHELIHYPYGCVEQTSSRLLPLVAIRELKQTFPMEVDVDALTAAGIERILSMQVPSGGFAYWPGGDQASVYASAYATWVLTRAQKAGAKVPQAALDQALDYVARIAVPNDAPRGYDDLGEIRRAIAVHVLADADRPVKEAVKHLFERRQRLPLFARAFLLMALHRAGEPGVDALTDELLGDLVETAGSAHAHEVVAFDLSEAFHSDGRSDAIVLMALLRVRPDHPIVPKLARGLMDRRSGGAWRNTQENAYALVALADYVEVYEKTTPDFLARAWVGRVQLLDAAFRGRDASVREGAVEMAAILDGLTGGGTVGPPDLLPVILQRQGAGRLYYRLGAEWAPAGLDLPARSQGLTISRSLRTREGAVAVGTSIPPGDAVAVDIHVRAETRTPFVAIEVPIPSGLEPIQRELGRGQRAMVLPGSRGWWVSFEELRRDRVVLFADDLSPGDHDHTAFLRATTPGEYRVPPAVAEAMYAPEIYGRSTSYAVKIASPKP
ncbi:MAG: MG2 domain-containing protein [Nannocystaceae bacterium]